MPKTFPTRLSSLSSQELKLPGIPARHLITPTIAYMLIPVLGVALWNLAKKKDRQLSLFYIAWITATYLPWLIFGIFVQRMTFNYYFIYTIPALALGIPYLWDNLPLSSKNKKIGLLAHLAVTVAFFFVFYPVVLIR